MEYKTIIDDSIVYDIPKIVFEIDGVNKPILLEEVTNIISNIDNI